VEKDQELRQLDLEGVIAYLEGEAVAYASDPQAARQWLGALRKALHRNDFKEWVVDKKNRPDLSWKLDKEHALSERLDNSLAAAWADYRFWRMLVPKNAPASFEGSRIRYFLTHYYHLSIPFGDGFWRELQSKPKDFDWFLYLIGFSANRFFWVQSVTPSQELSDENLKLIQPEPLGQILYRYARNPGADWRPWLALQALPIPVLERLLLAVNKAVKDLAWILKNPDRIEPRRPPPLPYRARSYVETRSIELMVGKLRQDPEMTCYMLAKECLGRVSAAGRKLAHEAQLLAVYRDRIPVKLHKRPGGRARPGSATKPR
jgi:hypothetical protein